MPGDSDRVFWLCHSCGAQMRPIRVDGVRQCASCSSEFIEILDSEINPDPRNDLPPPPPSRPRSTDRPVTHQRRSISPETSRNPPGRRQHRATDPNLPGHGGNGVSDLFGSVLSGFLGGLRDPSSGEGSNQSQNPQDGTNHHTHPHPHANQQDTPAQRRAGPSARTYQFNIGGGTGSVTFGSFGMGGGGSGGQGGPMPMGMGAMFGAPNHGHGRGGGYGHPMPMPMPGGFGQFGGGAVGGHAGDQGGGLDAFFPGFPPPARGREGQAGNDLPRPNPTGGPIEPPDMFRLLMGIFGNDITIINGPQGRMDVGDYAATEHGFNDILEALMQQAGPQGPIPATDAVIEGLPRSTLDEQSIEKSQFKDCPICKDDFAPGDEIMKIPCEHIYHVECLQPWLRQNGSCAVCRFSLVPDEANTPRAAQPQTPAGDGNTASPPNTGNTQPDQSGPGVLGPISNILHRLWGQSGAVPSSASTGPETGAGVTPTVDPVAPPASTSAIQNAQQRVYDPPTGPPPTRDPPSPPPPTREPADQDNQPRTYDPPEGPPPTHDPPSPPALAPEEPAIAQEPMSNSIPDDYRARHRQREQEQKEQNH